jgi:hypothetical protein
VGASCISISIEVPVASRYPPVAFEDRTAGYRPASSTDDFEFPDGRMAYSGSVKDDTKQILGREPFLLKEWAKIHANELLQIAGS